MSQESPEQQMPLALSPTALAQRDANMIPTEYPKSIGKKTLDARYARDARWLGRNADDDAMTRTAAVSDLSFSFFFVADDDEATPLELTFPRRTLRLLPRRFRSPTDSNMSPASKFVNAKKGGKRSSHGCVRARAVSPRPTRRRLAFTKSRKRKKTDVSVSTRRCMPSQLEGNFRRAAPLSQPGASRFAAPPSRFSAQR